MGVSVTPRCTRPSRWRDRPAILYFVQYARWRSHFLISQSASLSLYLKTEEVTLKIVDIPGAAVFSVETTAAVKIEVGPKGVTIDSGQGSTIKVDPEEIRIENDRGAVIDLKDGKVAIERDEQA
jgi:hypothetical protein